MNKEPPNFKNYQEELFRALSEKSNQLNQLGDIYKKTLSLISQTENSDYIAFYIHGLRELQDKLPRILEAPYLEKIVLLNVLVNPITRAWEELTSDKNWPKNPNWKKPIDTWIKPIDEKFRNFLKLCSELIPKIQENHPEFGEQVTKCMESVHPFLQKEQKKKWMYYRELFNAVAHYRRKISLEQFKKEVKSFEIFVLNILRPKPLEDIQKFKEVIESPVNVTPERLKEIIDLIKKWRINYEFFFKNLESPDWFEPLESEGLLTLNPSDQRIDEGGYIRFTFWPPAKYLIKIANRKPNEILELIQRIETDNVRVHGVHEDFVEAACNMPAKEAAQVVPFAIKWLEEPYMFVLWEGFYKLLAKLASEGEPKAAFALADRLLDVREDPGNTENDIEFDKVALFVSNEWEYQRILSKSFPKLIDAIKEKAIFLLFDKLDKAIKIERNVKTEDFEDLSSIWRGSIEDSDQTRPYNLKSKLVTGVRDASYYLLKIDPEKLSTLVERLREYSLSIFSRIAIHLVNKFCENVELPKKFLFDEFDNVFVWHEYALLLRKWFPKLDEESQENYLKKIDQVAPSKEDEKRNKRAQFYYLTMIKEYLKGETKDKFEKYKKEFGELPQPTYHVYFSDWYSPQSPKSKDELKDMLPRELAQYLREWKPKNGEFDIRCSIEALGEELESVVKEQSIDFIRNIDFFKEIDRIYVRSIIRGVSAGIGENSKNGKFLEQVNWDNILNYCIWASSPLDDSKEGIDDKNDGRDSSWSCTRKEIASFLQSGLQSGLQSDAIPISKKDLVWRALEPCFEDKDPTPEKEEKYLKDNNYYQEAINCVRGKALETLVMYGLWIINARSLKSEDCRFDHYPEIKGVLERHLDVDYEPSLSVRSIYGRYLRWLFYLDNSWTIQNLQNIFSEGPGLEKYYEAAWSTYITSCGAFDSVFKKIREYYEKFLDKAKNSSKESYRDDSPEARYIHHLMIFYYRGSISLDDPLIIRLFEELDLSLRKTAISYIGKNLRKEDKENEDLPEVKERLLSLMDYRFKKLKKKDSQEDKLELAAFGGWFVSNQFEIKWSLEKLKETLELCGFIEPGHFVMDFLRDQSRSYPDLVMDCLDLIIKYATDHSEFDLWVFQTEEILVQVLCSESQQAKYKAEDLIHRLLAAGHRNFENLLT